MARTESVTEMVSVDMKSDEQTLLAAIAANPAEDLPRLVFADWLDENGRSLRADFIRLQCEIARLATLPRHAQDAHVAIYRREQELRDQAIAVLLDSENTLPFTSMEVTWSRGFMNEISLRVETFLEHGERLSELLPRPQITVTHISANLPAFLASPHLDCVTGLRAYDEEIQNVPFTGEVLESVEPFATEAIRRLNSLRLLDLEGCRVTDSLIEILIPPGAYPALEELDLSSNWITDVGVVTLLNGGVPQRLKRLILGGNQIGDQAAIELADRLGRSTKLEHLNLRFTNITQIGQLALLNRFGSRVDLF